MKFYLLRVIVSVAFSGLALLKPAMSFGQEFEAAASDSAKAKIRNAEELIYLEEEHSLDRMPMPAKDSAYTRSGHHQNHQQRQRVAAEPTKQVEKRKEEKDDSIMSFNFLYYIFKKFKLSDIVDDE